MISAKIIADSVTPAGHRLTTYVITYPRLILAEVNTHRMLSKNSASSRAIPIMRMIRNVWSNPAMPISWGVNGRGMQAKSELTGIRRWMCAFTWRLGSKLACIISYMLYKLGSHKQISNRVTEPWQYMTTVVSATEWSNFFNLRAHKDAQPEFRELALQMLEAYVASTPKQLQWGEWHLPFADKFLGESIAEEDLLKIVSARGARVSYNNFEGEIEHAKDYALTDSLIQSKHMSPLEHAGMAAERVEERQRSNFTGYIQYRKTIPGENQTELDADKILSDNGRSPKKVR